jgi:hypothetical protein
METFFVSIVTVPVLFKGVIWYFVPVVSPDAGQSSMKPRPFLKLIYPVSLVFFLLVIAGPALAKDEWIQVKSKNFLLIGNASEKDIRRVGTRLEQFRETFRQLFANTNLTASIPTNVIVFKSGAAYKPFKPKRADGKLDTFVAGFFQPGEENYITLSTEGER